jgi:hypothetical protein
MEYIEQDSFKIKICGIKKGDIIHYSSFDPGFQVVSKTSNFKT